jgi:hypothetical protein
LRSRKGTKEMIRLRFFLIVNPSYSKLGIKAIKIKTDRVLKTLLLPVCFGMPSAGFEPATNGL